MRIWVVNPFDDVPGEGAQQRYPTICSELARRGHEVTWWTSRWSHRRKQWRNLKSDSVDYEIVLVDVPEYKKNVSLARIRNHRQFARNLLDLGHRRILDDQEPDLVLFSWPPVEASESVLSWREACGCDVVIDLMDVWPDNFLFLAPNNPVARSVVKLLLKPWDDQANRICQTVDRASAQSHTFADFVRKRGGPESVHVCYLGGQDRFLAKDSLEKNSGELRLVYIGALGKVYDLETLIHGIAQLKMAGQTVYLDICGQGEKEADLLSQIEQLEVGELVRCHGYLQGADFYKQLSKGDVGVIPMFPDSQVAVPYKAGDYFSAGLPIINSLPGEMQELLEQNNCGISYSAGDVASFVEGVRVYLSDHDRLVDESGNARQLFTDRFDRSKTYCDWAEWLEGNVS
ncbi:MAG: glycosyltransferase family 4 protein [Verrucomicrobiota bacterium]